MLGIAYFFKLNFDIFTKTHSSTQIRSLPLQVGLHQGEHERDRLVGHRPLLHLPQVRGYSLRAKMTNSLLPSLSNMKSSGEYEDEMRRIAQVFVTNNILTTSLLDHLIFNQC